MANLLEHRQFATKLRRERAMSEAAVKDEVQDAAPAIAWPSTPQNARRVPRQGWSACEDEHASPRFRQGTLKATEGQLPPTFQPGDRIESFGKSQVLRGVITGPARWRNGAVSHGTPILYCAVYRYHTSPKRASEEAGEVLTAESKNAGGLPPPELLSSSWGQGPLVIEGVPVPEKRTNPEDVADSHQSAHVLVVGVFRNSLGCQPPEASFCGGGASPLQKNWASLPRPNELLGVLYVPLHCVHLTDSQQEVKLRLPVISPQPPARSPSDGLALVKDERERELAAVLSPACSLENLEAVFKRGLTANTTGINRCNVMLFRVSSSTETLTFSDTLLRAALAAPPTPSMASTAKEPSSNAVQHHQHSSEAVSKFQERRSPSALNVSRAGVGTAAAGGLEPGDRGALVSSSAGDSAKAAERAPYGRGVCGNRTPSRSETCRSAVLQSPTNSSPELFTQERQRQRQQRQQELSVAAVLAASAIAAAARGERDRSVRSSASRQPSAPGKIFEGLNHTNPRPSSACSLVHHKGSNSLSLRSHQHVRSNAPKSLAALSDRPQQTARDQRNSDAIGEPDVSPDDSVSVRGDDAQLLAAAMLSRAGGTSNGLLSSGLRGRLLAPAADELRLDCIPDDRKSTLSTSIRRLDCLMTRAQLLLSQRRHSQQHRDNHHDVLNCNVRSEQDKPTDARPDPSAKVFQAQEATQKMTCEEDYRKFGHESSRTGASLAEEVDARPASVDRSLTPSHWETSAASAACFLQVKATLPGVSKDIFVARAVKTITTVARRPMNMLTQKTWLQETRRISQQRRVAGLRMAAACASVACHGTLKRQQLQLGWMALEARARNSSNDARGPEAEGGTVEDLRHQLEEKDKHCQLLERRASEERFRHTQELASLRKGIVQLDEETRDSRKESELSRPSEGQQPEDRKKLRQELDRSLQECRDLKLLVADHAAAKSRSDEERKSLQIELALNQQRTKDLEQQLMLVDEQLVAILRRAVPKAPPQQQHERGAEAVEPWAIQQLQCMHDALNDVQQKRPLASSADARRQPPAETGLPTPLRQLSRDRSVASDKGKAPQIQRSRQQGRSVSTGSLGPPLQHHSAAAAEEIPKNCGAPLQPQLQAVPPPISQLGGTQSTETLEAFRQEYARTPQRMGRSGRQGVDAYPAGLVPKFSEPRGNVQHNAFLPVPHGSSARSQQVREQLDRQRTHRQQLLHMGVHPMQQMQGGQPLPAPPASHLQTSFIAPVVGARLHSPAASYVACPIPAQPLQQANQQHVYMQPHMRAPSPLQHAHAPRSRLQARCVGHSVT
ncbi:hypothetical protein Emag_001641 [Eimeria magna]